LDLQRASHARSPLNLGKLAPNLCDSPLPSAE
jgi:hypothetical protein